MYVIFFGQNILKLKKI